MAYTVILCVGMISGGCGVWLLIIGPSLNQPESIRWRVREFAIMGPSWRSFPGESRGFGKDTCRFVMGMSDGNSEPSLVDHKLLKSMEPTGTGKETNIYFLCHT